MADSAMMAHWLAIVSSQWETAALEGIAAASGRRGGGGCRQVQPSRGHLCTTLLVWTRIFGQTNSA